MYYTLEIGNQVTDATGRLFIICFKEHALFTSQARPIPHPY